MKGKELNMCVSNHAVDGEEIGTSIETTPVECSLSDLGEIRLEMVSGSSLEPLWNILVRKYHYLGHQRIFGRRLKYLAFVDRRPIAALGWKTASIRLEARDCFIGWSDEQRKKYLKHVVNNNRFLIPEWIRVPNLASHLLASSVNAVTRDWQQRYGQRLFLLETFVNPVYFKGSSYRAANWIYVGNTKGYGLGRAGYEYHGLIKEVYVYVVERDFRKILGCRQRPFFWKCPISQKKEKADSMIIQRADYDPDLIDWEGLSPDMIEKLAEELVEFHDEFRDAFCRVEQSILGQYYLQGLLGEIRRKNVEAIALQYLGASRVRALQKFMTNYRWDDAVMLVKANTMLSYLIAEENGMITLDGSDIPKKGNESVGVSRQYCGNTGKTDNCQAGVFVGYTSTKGYGLIDRELYMPEQWFSEKYQERREKCQVPEGLRFKTKNQIGLELIRKALDEGLFPAGWVGFDAGFGSDSKFRDAVDSLQVKYLGDIRSNTLVWLNRPQVGIPTYSGKGRPPEKERVLEGEPPPIHVSDIASNPELEWDTTILAQGAQGPVIAELCFLRVVEHRDGLPGKDLWLVMRRDVDGKLRFAFSNEPEDIPKEEMKRAVTMRWPIEQCFEDGKKYLGMDHYEHRSWPGWHRHMTYVILAMLFLLRLRFKFKKKFLR
ncbi:MAG: IS701 family transposase [Desulfobacterales bacterium]|nr:IS701 family transposase [Desulfobacterales bacterium]